MTVESKWARRRLSAVAQPEPSGSESNQGPTHDDVVRAIYNDRRASPEQRELLLAVAYALCLAPREEGVSPLREARRVLGAQGGIIRYDRLVRADIPRYEPPREAGNWGPSNAPSCEAPRIRPYRPRPNKPAEPDPTAPVPIRTPELPPELAALYEQAMGDYSPPRDWRTEDGVCGAQSHHRVLEKDPRTGWVIPHWFCKRHHDHAKRVAEQVRAQNETAPEPIPNRGGLLSCYFKADWEQVYRHYAGKFWKPPTYGLCADDWPTPGKTLPGRGRLRMVASGIDVEEDV